jgi:hypothetical protein
MVLECYERDELDEAVMNDLVNRHYKLAVITLEEDARLNKLARSVAYETPNARWAACDIVFQFEPTRSSSSSAQIGGAT